MTFSESSGMIKVARINQNLMSSLWRSMKEHNWFFKLLLLLPALFYSVLCMFFVCLFYIASVIDVIPYMIAKLANGMASTAGNISRRKYGFWATIFYPIFVFVLGLLFVFIVILPKAIRLGDEG